MDVGNLVNFCAWTFAHFCVFLSMKLLLFDSTDTLRISKRDLIAEASHTLDLYPS